MENTPSLLFDDPTPCWYLAAGEKWVGPFPAAEVYAKLTRGEATWAHYIWRTGQKEWQRICDTAPFQALVPSQPAARPGAGTPGPAGAGKPIGTAVAKTKKSPALGGEVTPLVVRWFLYHNETQYGPFASEEVRELLRAGRVSEKVFAWREGLEDWKRLGEIAEFVGVKPPVKASAVRTKSTELEERRAAPRAPLVATIRMADDARVLVGVCRDISVGGMQVLCDRIPGKVGSRIRLNVSGPGALSSKASASAGSKPSLLTRSRSIQAFVAEGVVVRLLEDGKGFSFRFSKLSPEARRAIEAFVGASAPALEEARATSRSAGTSGVGKRSGSR